MKTPQDAIVGKSGELGGGRRFAKEKVDQTGTRAEWEDKGPGAALERREKREKGGEGKTSKVHAGIEVGVATIKMFEIVKMPCLFGWMLCLAQNLSWVFSIFS